MSTDHSPLQQWLDDIEAPAGFEAAVLDGVRRRRRVRTARAAALTTAACLTAAAMVVGWPRGAVTDGPDRDGTGPGPCTSVLAEASRRTQNGLALQLLDPTEVGFLEDSIEVRVQLTNIGLRGVAFTDPEPPHLCVFAPGGAELTARGSAFGSGIHPGDLAGLAPGRTRDYVAFWNTSACQPAEDPASAACTPRRVPASGNYLVYAWIDVHTEGRDWRLVSPPASVRLIQIPVRG